MDRNEVIQGATHTPFYAEARQAVSKNLAAPQPFCCAYTEPSCISLIYAASSG